MIPRRISDKTLHLDLTGYLSPFFSNNQPLLLNMVGVSSETLYLSVFDEVDKLRRFALDYSVSYDKIIKIEDGFEFLDSIPGEIIIAVNPYKHESGTCRYTQIFRSEEEAETHKFLGK